MIGQSILLIALFQADATYQNMAKTVIDVETATSFRTRPEAKSVLAKVLLTSALP